MSNADAEIRRVGSAAWNQFVPHANALRALATQLIVEANEREQNSRLEILHVLSLRRLEAGMHASFSLARDFLRYDMRVLNSSLMETSFSMLYLGADDERAKVWWDANCSFHFPWSVETTVNGVIAAGLLEGPPETLTGHYHWFCEAKHGNFLAGCEVFLRGEDLPGKMSPIILPGVVDRVIALDTFFLFRQAVTLFGFGLQGATVGLDRPRLKSRADEIVQTVRAVETPEALRDPEDERTADMLAFRAGDVEPVESWVVQTVREKRGLRTAYDRAKKGEKKRKATDGAQESTEES